MHSKAKQGKNCLEKDKLRLTKLLHFLIILFKSNPEQLEFFPCNLSLAYLKILKLCMTDIGLYFNLCYDILAKHCFFSHYKIPNRAWNFLSSLLKIHAE